MEDIFKANTPVFTALKCTQDWHCCLHCHLLPGDTGLIYQGTGTEFVMQASKKAPTNKHLCFGSEDSLC